MNDFIQRRYENIQDNTIVSFENIIKKKQIRWSQYQPSQYSIVYKSNVLKIFCHSSISIILGEPASGKTYQLREYSNRNEQSYFLELVNLDVNESIEDNTNIVLIDSIDEALTIYENIKQLQKKLTIFIKECKTTNPNIRFVISCRFLEWSKYFESSLKEIDDKLSVYKILPLEKEDIDILLQKKNIKTEEFWEFIESNHLDSLLKNILVLLYIVDNFNNYKKQSLTFIDIYQDLSKKYLLKRGSDRKEQRLNIPIDKLLKISLSLAAYMTFNNKVNIDVSNLDEVVGELYSVDTTPILSTELEIVLDSALFEQNKNGLSFFHKSIQEYLTAYFLSTRNLSLEKLKELVASDLRFYEEFEEVVVFLTNIDNNLFTDFVKFDPFIFKRHPSLTKEQQEKLLLSILNKLKINFSQVWGRWESLSGTTLVSFDKLDNITSLLQENVSLRDQGFYLMKLLENNYSNEFRSFMFELFEKNIENKELLKNILRSNFIDNYDFNIYLYEFLQNNFLLEKDNNAFFLSFEAELFSSLYGIQYKYKYGSQRIVKRTTIPFLRLIPLLDYIPSASLQYIAPYLLKEDAKTWFEYIIKNKNKYSYEYINWVVYVILNHCTQVDEFKSITLQLKNNEIFLHSIDKEKMQIDFVKVADIFWKIYFDTNILEDFFVNQIISFYKISSKDIEKALIYYPLDDYVEKYAYFSSSHQFLDDYDLIQEYLIQSKKKIEEQNRKIEENYIKRHPQLYKERQAEKKIRDEKNQAIKRLQKQVLEDFATKKERQEDIYTLFALVFKEQYSEWLDVDKKVKELLKDKYTIFIDRIKELFKTDIIYKKIPQLLTAHHCYQLNSEGKRILSLDVNTLVEKKSVMFVYLFEILDYEELDSLIRIEKEYKKFFWYSYKNNSELSEKFIQLSQKYFQCFLLLSLYALKASLKYSNNTRIGHYYFLINVYKKLDKFDYENLKNIIQYIKECDIILGIKEEYEKETLLSIFALDKTSFEYTEQLIKNDQLKLSEYFYTLLKIDVKKAMEYFLKIYNRVNLYRSLYSRIKNRIYKKTTFVNKYDKFEINPKKIELYQILTYSIQKSKINLDSLEIPYIKMILIDYYRFFDEYKTPKGVYSPDVYDNMYRFINTIWQYMENDSIYIDTLDYLSKFSDKRLSDIAKYTLTKVYELQRKNRNYPNSYYKKVFDMENKENNSNININVTGNQNNISLGDNNIQRIENSNKSKKDSWWLISLVVSLICGGVVWWQFSLIFGVAISIMIFIIMLFFNPKRRFWIAAWTVFSIAGINGIIHLIGTLKIPENPYLRAVVEFGKNDNIFITGILLVLAGFLFWLDYKERR